MSLKTLQASYTKGDMPSPHIAVSVEAAISGYFATIWVWTVVDCSRNEDGTPMCDDGFGFWEPEDTSPFRFPTRDEALVDAHQMAKDLELPFWEAGKQVYTPPELTQEELEAEKRDTEQFIKDCREFDEKRKREQDKIPF